MGIAYHLKGELDISFEYHEKGFRLFEEVGTQALIAGSLFQLSKLMLVKDRQHVGNYLNRLKQIANESDSKLIILLSQLTEALFLKSSNRTRSIGKAHDILEAIVQEETIDFNISKEAMLNLCEILLIEYRNFEEEEILEEALELLDLLYERAEEQHSFLLSIEVLVLKARVKITHGDFNKATKLLEQALQFAEDKGITGLIPRIKDEQGRMKENIDLWGEMLDKNASARERMKRTELKDYLEKVIKYADRM